MLISSEKTGANEYTLSLCVDKKDFDAACNKVYNKQKSKINIKGFRPGKAPRTIIERVYGEDVFYSDAIEEVFPPAYDAAVKEAGLRTVSDPFDFDVDFKGENGPVVTMKVYVRPELDDITVGEYKGIEAVRQDAREITDADVDAAVDAEVKKNGRELTVEDRAVENGDIVNIDYEGFTGGVAFDGGKAEGQDLEIGSGSFIPGFEEQIIGHNIGEDFDITVTFPEEYGAEELAGKEAVFKIKLHGIKKVEYPEADDEFATEVSDFDTMDEYKADIRKQLTDRAETEARENFKNEVLDKLAELVEGDIPEAMFDSAADERVREFMYRVSSQGMSPEQYLSQLGLTPDTLKGIYRPQAEKSVKTELALDKIASLEGIEVTDEDVAANYADIAKQYGISEEDCKKYFSEDSVREGLLRSKAADLVTDAAVAVDAPEEPAEEASDAEAETAEEPAAEE